MLGIFFSFFFFFFSQDRGNCPYIITRQDHIHEKYTPPSKPLFILPNHVLLLSFAKVLFIIVLCIYFCLKLENILIVITKSKINNKKLGNFERIRIRKFLSLTSGFLNTY